MSTLGMQQVEVNQTIDYTYDPLNRLTSTVYDDGSYYQYTYDAVGNRLTETTPTGTDTYTYNENSWVVLKNGTSWSYDPAGNLRSDGIRNYDYDAANRLKWVSDRSAYVQTSYAYNGLGDRLQSTSLYYPTGESTTTNYTLDLNTNLTQVLADGTNTYTYGYNRIAQISETQTGHFLGDALGSVRQVADKLGAVNLVQSYSPYGEVISSVGSYETAFSYTGEMTDGTGLVFLRARYYDPATGRFLNKDTWGGDYNNPITLAKWLYANGNPVNNLDPFGQATLESLVLFTVGRPYSGKFKRDGSQNGDEYGNNRTTYNSPGWTEKEKRSIYGALLNISNAYYDAYKYELYRRSNSCTPLYLLLQKTNRYDVFLSIHGGPITFERTAENAKQYFSDPTAGAWAYTLSPRKILIFSNATADNVERNPRWIVHDVGHAFENAMLETIGSKVGRDNLPRNLLTRKIENEQFAGFHGGFSSWQYSRDVGSGEIFADMFIGWVYNQWEVSNNEFTPTAIKRSDYMEKNMSGWIMSVISER